MKSAILQCLQQFPVKTAKRFIMTKFLKSLNYSGSAKMCKTFVLASK